MRRNQKGFTLMELMVVIVIVAILAAVAVPLYINYVQDAQRTEARGAIGAIITGEQAYLQRHPAIGYADLPTLVAEGLVNVQEAQVNWTFTVTPSGTAANPGYNVTANGVAGRPSANLTVTYDYLRSTGGEWDRPAAP
jgi:prepilin-type N-terminal cleavage/methylation domain-containing protein